MKKIRTLALIANLLVSTWSFFLSSVVSADNSKMANGIVRNIDKDTNKITIKHDGISQLAIPDMTMVFQVKDRALLDKVAVGDKVKFKAVRDVDKVTVTTIEVEK